jgi:hypothetical protein
LLFVGVGSVKNASVSLTASDGMAAAKFFSSLACRSKYWSISVVPVPTRCRRRARAARFAAAVGAFFIVEMRNPQQSLMARYTKKE